MFLPFLLQQNPYLSYLAFYFPSLNILLFVQKRKKKSSQKQAKKSMSGLYNPNFSPARAASPQIRSTPDVDRYATLVISFCEPRHFFLQKKIKYLVFLLLNLFNFLLFINLCGNLYFLICFDCYLPFAVNTYQSC